MYQCKEHISNKGEDLLSFVNLAEEDLPKSIKILAENPNSMICLARVTGLLLGLMVATTGHRKCVFLRMTAENVKNAEAYKKTFNIRVRKLAINYFFARLITLHSSRRIVPLIDRHKPREVLSGRKPGIQYSLNINLPSIHNLSLVLSNCLGHMTLIVML